MKFADDCSGSSQKSRAPGHRTKSLSWSIDGTGAMPEIVDSREILARIRAAQEKQAQSAEAPRPLMREVPPPDPFPVEALGTMLANAAIGIQDRTRAPIAICAQSVMAAATLVTQAHADVRLPTGQLRPVSNFFATVAVTGERNRQPTRSLFGQSASARKRSANYMPLLDRNTRTKEKLGNARVLTPRKLAKEMPARSRRRLHNLARHQMSRCRRFSRSPSRP